MNTYRKIVLTTLVLIIIIFISSCSVSFRRSNRASGDVQGSGSSDSLTVDPPIFNPAGGSVKRGIGVSIMSATEGAQVYYNIGDGTQADPSPGIDLLYDESNKPVITHNNMVIKAKSFKTGYTPSNVVSYNYALTPQIFVGGAFTTYGNIYNKLVRVNSDGTLDSSFNPGTGATGPNDNIRSILIQSNGKILVNGYFQSFNGVVHHGLVRLNSDGSLDTSFDPNFITETDSITMQNDGKILVAGVFKNPDDTSYHGIIRLNTDGSLDTSFNSDRYKIANPILMAGMVIIQPDGEILAIENFVSGGTPHGHVVRLNNDGTLDPSFNENDFNFYIDKISLQDDGNTIVT
ncbi:MAG: chitobiase/beta-hexosaminidase C-terminal domain-containing protein, partial [Proteobacteria bacterium]|nr:chitobiase/beta-hexosaminidase C-terminal domain-containing protein [Pseudomonadota bacterium]